MTNRRIMALKRDEQEICISLSKCKARATPKEEPRHELLRHSIKSSPPASVFSSTHSKGTVYLFFLVSNDNVSH